MGDTGTVEVVFYVVHENQEKAWLRRVKLGWGCVHPRKGHYRYTEGYVEFWLQHRAR